MAEEVESQSLPPPENTSLPMLESLVPARAYRTPRTTTISFGDLLEPPLLLHEDLKEGCGGQLWPAGMVLARYMLRYHLNDLVDKTM